MLPELRSVKLEAVTDEESVVEIKYRASNELEGIELMGVDANLSWIKNESILLEPQSRNEDTTIYSASLRVKDDCEFRARGFDGENDHWEKGKQNHRIERNKDGTIEFITELERDFYEFHSKIPVEYNPSIEVVKQRINNIFDEEPKILQAMVDLSIFIKPIFEDDPLIGDIIHTLPKIQQYLKKKSREVESYKLDEVVLPVVKALFMIYKMALEFAKDDIRLLTGEWENREYPELFSNLPEQVRELEGKQLGRGKDTGKRYKDLLKYVS